MFWLKEHFFMSDYRFMPHGVSFAIRLRGMILYPLPLSIDDRSTFSGLNGHKKRGFHWLVWWNDKLEFLWWYV